MLGIHDRVNRISGTSARADVCRVIVRLDCYVLISEKYLPEAVLD